MRPPLLFVHGAGHAAWCWDEHFLPWFAAHGYSVSAVSLRGHGGSDGADVLRWSSVADYVDDVRSVALGFAARPVLIGHSLGGLVVQKYLERYEAAGAVLLAPSPVQGMLRPGLRLLGSHPLAFLRTFLRLDPGVLFATPHRARHLLFSPGTRSATIDRHAPRLGRESFRALLDMAFNLPRIEQIRRGRCPMLVIGAGRDGIVPADAIEATARAYGATYAVVPDSGHDLMLDEQWEFAAGRIREWLTSSTEDHSLLPLNRTPLHTEFS